MSNPRPPVGGIRVVELPRDHPTHQQPPVVHDGSAQSLDARGGRPRSAGTGTPQGQSYPPPIKPPFGRCPPRKPLRSSEAKSERHVLKRRYTCYGRKQDLPDRKLPLNRMSQSCRKSRPLQSRAGGREAGTRAWEPGLLSSPRRLAGAAD